MGTGRGYGFGWRRRWGRRGAQEVQQVVLGPGDLGPDLRRSGAHVRAGAAGFLLPRKHKSVANPHPRVSLGICEFATLHRGLIVNANLSLIGRFYRLCCAEQKQRLTVVAARFFDYGCRGSHLKTVGMALQVQTMECKNNP